ncbi:hypothetical protein [Burkholderia gladioli]|uniref:hypothetical protein n=1 Tax=Burkholderia gladioli TaxID=28095 RepID=UPI00163E5494|nr:hypothetical protein [Burkholderia gladioli]
MKSIDFFEVARVLLACGDAESMQRSSVSRAYYGVLHACREALPEAYAPTKAQLNAAGSHKATIAAMQQWGASSGKGRAEAQRIARSIVQLKRLRVCADYELGREWKINAQLVLRDAIAIAKLANVARENFDKQE